RNLTWQWTHDVHARIVNLAEEGQPDVGITVLAHDEGICAAWHAYQLRLHLLGDAELLERLLEAHAGCSTAGPVGIRDRPRSEQHLSDCIRCRYVGLCCSFIHRDRHRNRCEWCLAAGND